MAELWPNGTTIRINGIMVLRQVVDDGKYHDNQLRQFEMVLGVMYNIIGLIGVLVISRIGITGIDSIKELVKSGYNVT